MFWRLIFVALLASVIASSAVLAQPRADQARSSRAKAYSVPRTAHGHPDFQGIWVTAFLTMLERLPGVEGLVATPEQAEKLVAAIRGKMPPLADPQVFIDDIKQLVRVRGEYRTSIIVDPPDGRMPYTKAGLEMLAKINARNDTQFDNPEERPFSERCLENLGYPPIRTVPVFLPRQIVQTADYVVIANEDVPGSRFIHLKGGSLPESMRSIGGYSVGRWEGDTLVVKTTNLRTDDPARTLAGPRTLLLGPDTRITEWFTRVSDTELVYRYTVDDATLYTQPWTGEFSMTRLDVKTFEYGCHEGNYSMTNMLRGGQAQAARKAAEAK
ncbi:MAG TPA: hypothetical protein VFS23_01090 [Vicinamibacterales bacterium]|nr:hypothetical protein [Vicinamibacterales bacterium]